MGLFNNFPYMDLSNLNLDFILKKLKDLTNYTASAETASAAAVSAKDAAEASAASAQSSALDAQAAKASAESYAEHIADPVGGLVTTWLDENIEPTTPPIDSSLSIQGAAADAKATGDAIAALDYRMDQSAGMSDDVKIALENLVNHLLFDEDDPTGQTYINALHDAMYPPAPLVSITAVYAGYPVEQGSAINDLKNDLTVTANYEDGSIITLSADEYKLSGDLSVSGPAVITVSYADQTTTFTVSVEEGAALLYDLPSTVSTRNYNTGVKLWSPEPISHTVLCEATFGNSGWNGKQAVLSHESNASANRQYRVGQDTTTGYKTALIIGTQAVSLFASSSSMLRRFAYSYNAVTGEVKAYAKNSGEAISALKQFTAGTVNASEDTVRLNSGATATTIPVSVLRIYGKVLSEQDMYDFVNALE